MADNDQIAASLRTLAEAADDDVAEHDLNSLADALDALDDDPTPLADAKSYLHEHNEFTGAVIEGGPDVEGTLFVYEPNTHADLADTPTGWHAYEALDGDGINFDPL